MKPKTKRQHEADRTEILRILRDWNFRPIAFESLLEQLDERYRPLTRESLAFSLRFMCEKGYVQCGEEKVLGENPKIEWVKITAAGIDELDRRTGGKG